MDHDPTSVCARIAEYVRATSKKDDEASACAWWWAFTANNVVPVVAVQGLPMGKWWIGHSPADHSEVTVEDLEFALLLATVEELREDLDRFARTCHSAHDADRRLLRDGDPTLTAE